MYHCHEIYITYPMLQLPLISTLNYLRIFCASIFFCWNFTIGSIWVFSITHNLVMKAKSRDMLIEIVGRN